MPHVWSTNCDQLLLAVHSPPHSLCINIFDLVICSSKPTHQIQNEQ